jgi:MFS family permease
VGPILDKTGIGQRKLLIGSSAAYALCWIPLVLAPAPGVLPFIYLSMGLMGAVDIIVLISINNHIRSTTDERIRGTVMGIINSITLLGGAVYQPVMGLFVNKTSEGYTTAFSLGIAGAAVSFAATLLLSRKFLH